MGNYTNAYATITPFKDTGVSEYAQREEELMMKRKALADEKVKAQALAKAQEQKKIAELKKPEITTTGYQSHDEPLMNFFNRADGFTERYAKLQIENEKNPSSDTSIKLRRMDDFITNVKESQKNIAGFATTLSTGLKDGTFSPSQNKDYVNGYNGIINGFQYDYDWDENGTPIVKSKFTNSKDKEGADIYDRNNDGIPDTFTLQDAMNPNLMANFNKLFVKSKDIENKKKEYGLLKTTEDNNGNYIETINENFDANKLNSLKSDIDEQFGFYEKMNPDAKSYIGDHLGLDPKKVTKEEFEKIKSDYVEDVTNAFGITKSTKKDYGAENSEARLRFDKLNQKKKEQETQATFAEATVPQEYKINKIDVIPNAKSLGFTNAPIVKGFTIKDKTYQNTQLQNMTNKKNKKGERMFTGIITHDVQVPVKDENGDVVLDGLKPKYVIEKRNSVVILSEANAINLLPNVKDNNGNYLGKKQKSKYFKDLIFKDEPKQKTKKNTAKKGELD